MPGDGKNITINLEVASAGWFLTNNIMIKVEYVNQEYQHYPADNILNGGRFKGTMVEASIGF
ncbi:MAG: hypothetical protein ABIY90_01430 [Puia sp.]